MEAAYVIASEILQKVPVDVFAFDDNFLGPKFKQIFLEILNVRLSADNFRRENAVRSGNDGFDYGLERVGKICMNLKNARHPVKLHGKRFVKALRVNAVRLVKLVGNFSRTP